MFKMVVFNLRIIYSPWYFVGLFLTGANEEGGDATQMRKGGSYADPLMYL